MRTGIFVVLVLCGLLSGCRSAAEHQQLAETRLQLALALLSRGDLAAADVQLAKAEQLLPGDYRVMLAQARCQQLQKNPTQAAAIYRRTLEIAAGNGYVLNNYGAFLCGLGQYEAAQQQFQAAAQSAEVGARADSYDNAGYCYLAARRLTEAEQALGRAVEADAEKGRLMLAEASRRFAQGEQEQARLLLDVYQRHAPATAESTGLEIRFAASAGRSYDVQR